MKKCMKKFISLVILLIIPGVIYLNWNCLDPFAKLILIASLTIVVPTVLHVLSLVLERKTKNVTAKQKREEKKAFDEKIDRIYFEERMQYYQDAHYLFNRLIRAGALNRSDILKLKGMINSSLGSYCREYKDKKFKNDIHEIYSKMKNHHIDERDWAKIIQFLTLKAY